MTPQRNKQVVLHNSGYDLSDIKSILLKKKFEIIEGRIFAEIKNQLKDDQLFATFGVVTDDNLSCIDFMRSMMEYSPITQRVILTNTSNLKTLKKVINRSHIDYLLSFPVISDEFETYIRKIPRRYKRLNRPFENFDALTEVTESLLNQNEKFREQASSDALTKLLNRRSFNRILKRFWENHLNKNVSFSLALLDLDYFKKVNDTYGHTAGDIVLRAVADIFKSSQRRGIDFAFRYGGEEFAILSSATNLKEMELYINRLNNMVRNSSINLGTGQNIKITVSAGVGSCEKANSVKELIEQVDESLYKAKQSGRDRVVTTEIEKELV